MGDVFQSLSIDLHLHGFGVLQPFRLSWYNESVPQELGACLPSSGTAGDGALAILVGNTKELWDAFTAACKVQPALLEKPDPLDSWVVQTVLQAANSQREKPTRVYWSHQPAADLVGGAPYLPLQHLAEAVGLAYLDPNSHLCLHPKHGPWFSLRAVLVYDDIEYNGTRQPPVPCPLDKKTQQYVRFVARSARNSSISRSASTSSDSSPLSASSPACSPASLSPPPSLPRTPSAPLPPAPRTPSRDLINAAAPRPTSMEGAAAACVAAQAAVRQQVLDAFPRSASSGPLEPAGSFQLGEELATACRSWTEGDGEGIWGMQRGALVKACWEKWVAVRDAPFPGHPRRFYKDQIAYHYTQDIEILRKAIAAPPPPPIRIVTRTQSVTQLPWVLAYTT